VEEVVTVLAAAVAIVAWGATVGWQRAAEVQRRAEELAAELAHERAWRMARVFADAARPAAAAVMALLGRRP